MRELILFIKIAQFFGIRLIIILDSLTILLVFVETIVMSPLSFLILIFYVFFLFFFPLCQFSQKLINFADILKEPVFGFIDFSLLLAFVRFH